jgi:hypothetical protein
MPADEQWLARLVDVAVDNRCATLPASPDLAPATERTGLTRPWQHSA